MRNVANHFRSDNAGQIGNLFSDVFRYPAPGIPTAPFLCLGG